MKEVILKVNGMVCEGCENRVQKSLKEIDGVENVVANHHNNTVKIVLKEDVSINTIKNAIEDIGYEVVE